MRVIYNFLVYIVLLISPLIIIYRIFKKKEKKTVKKGYKKENIDLAPANIIINEQNNVFSIYKKIK